MLKYQQGLDNEGPEDRDERPFKEYSKPTIEKIGTRYYLIASEVYDLTRWGHKLDEQEMTDLPIRHCYIGKEVYFKSNKKEAFTILMRIISNGNKLQDPEFYSFLLGMLYHIPRSVGRWWGGISCPKSFSFFLTFNPMQNPTISNRESEKKCR